MSDIDKLQRYFKKVDSKLDNLEDFTIEIQKIRIKTLRKLCILCYVRHVDFFKYMGDMKPPFNIDSIKQILGCGTRVAYDYYRTMVLIDKLDDKSNENLIKSMQRKKK